MNDMSGVGQQPPGWYPAQGDPPGTVRWWDGEKWVGGPQQQGAQQQAGYVAPGAGTLANGRDLADPWLRIAAKVIDFIITFIVAIPIALAFGLGDVFADVLSGGSDSVSVGTTVAAGIATGLWNTAYYAGCNTFFSGTPGKLILGMRIVKADGTEPLGTPTGIIRSLVNVAKILEAIPILGVVFWLARTGVSLVSLVFLFSDAEHRTVMDRAADTYVVKKN